MRKLLLPLFTLLGTAVVILTTIRIVFSRVELSDRDAPAAVQTSPFEPPEANDHTFVVDDGSGLDTGCPFRSEGPLIIEIEVDRFPGDVNDLLANGLISEGV